MNGVEIANDMDAMVNRYLEELSTALHRLPGSRRDQLVDEIRQHITLMRAERPPVDRSDMEALLNRVGLPEDIAAVAMEGDDELAPVPLTVPPPPPTPPATRGRQLSRRTTALIAAAALVVVVLSVWALSRRDGGPVFASSADRIAFTLPGQPLVLQRPFVPAVRIVVPDLIGMSQAQAEAADAASDLTTDVVKTPSSSVPAGQVVAQSPVAGSIFLRPATITITVSSGPTS